MRGYPKNIATKQDFINLMAIPEYREQALADLKALADVQDDTMEVVKSFDTDEKGQMVKESVVTEKMPAPMPAWKRMGFKSRDEVTAITKGAL
jgi:hypothetical protein